MVHLHLVWWTFNYEYSPRIRNVHFSLTFGRRFSRLPFCHQTMTKLHPSCIIKVTWFSVDIISPLLNAFFLHIIVVLTATGYPLHLLKYLLLEKDPVTSGTIALHSGFSTTRTNLWLSQKNYIIYLYFVAYIYYIWIGNYGYRRNRNYYHFTLFCYQILLFLGFLK